MIRSFSCSAGRLKEGNHDEAGGRGEKKTTPISKVELIPLGHPSLNLSSFLSYSDITTITFQTGPADSNLNVSGSYAWNKKVRRTISAIQKFKEYIPLL